jgi:tripartite-type tricarboxylate transporter receptor subunit TctC
VRLSRRAALALPLLAEAARAQDWTPNRPLRLIVPYVAGGSVDIGARIIADRMGTTLGQAVAVENRGGSGGNIGAEAVVRSPPDGHTLLMGATGVLTTNQHIYPQMTFDPLRDLAPVAMCYASDLSLVVPASLPPRTLAEFIDYVKARPGELSYGSSGHGASTHTAMALFLLSAAIEAQHIPYRGSAAAMNDLLGGRLQCMMVQIATSTGPIREGRIRALAATGAARHHLIPEVPSIGELGFPQAQATSWGCIMAPAATPAPAIARLGAAAIEAVTHAPTAQRLVASGLDPLPMNFSELAAYLQAETIKWGRVAREARIRVE